MPGRNIPPVENLFSRNLQQFLEEDPWELSVTCGERKLTNK